MPRHEHFPFGSGLSLVYPCQEVEKVRTLRTATFEIVIVLVRVLLNGSVGIIFMDHSVHINVVLCRCCWKPG